MHDADPHITGERLRTRLDNNQPDQERMCAALLPTFGQFTSLKPGRPRGGPDGGRDIDAIYQGMHRVWCGIGWKNSANDSDSHRKWSSDKFRTDLGTALDDRSIRGFVFMTNVDLTVGVREQLEAEGLASGLMYCEIFDYERLLYTLNHTTEGLIPRLQYLKIPMSETEQIALFAKYGASLEAAITKRIDVVQATLQEMQRFLDFQKPIHRYDVYVDLLLPRTSSTLGNASILFKLWNVPSHKQSLYFCLSNLPQHQLAETSLIMGLTVWHDGQQSELILNNSISYNQNQIAGFFQFSISTMGQALSWGSLTFTELAIFVSEDAKPFVSRATFDMNGYQLAMISSANSQPEASVLTWSDSSPTQMRTTKWVPYGSSGPLDLQTNPPKPSGRFLALTTIS
jgi:hypothetical protein